MFRKYFILTIAVLVISVASASASIVTSITLAAQVAAGLAGIKDELTHLNLKQVFDNVLKIKEGKIGAIIQKFQSNTPFWAWNVQEGSLPENVNGRTTLTSEGMVTILDYDKLVNATDLSVAWTMIHEMVHAYLTLSYRFEPRQAKEDYPEIYIGWQVNRNYDYNELQHQEIEIKFMDDITEALKEYGSITNRNINEAIYADLAWGGLDFQNSSQLSETAKERVQDRLVAEQLNRRAGTAYPAGITSLANR